MTIVKEQQTDNIPLVSICCVTYNHEKYIRQTLEGFVIQQTTFPFEIIIYDDASTDSTQDIIREFVEKHSHLFKPIYQKENQFSKVKSGMNPRFTFPHSRGKYIALCEGDDYWIDSLKLQKQVNFLEANPEYNICFHNAVISIENIIQDERIYKPNRKKDITILDLLRGDYTKTCCSVFRYNHGMFEGRFELLQDTVMFMICLENDAKAYYLDEVMAVYRIHEGGVCGFKSKLNKLMSSVKIYEHLLTTYTQQNYNKIINNKLKKLSVEISFIYLKDKDLKAFFNWQKISFRYYSSSSYKIYFKLFRKYFFNKNLYKNKI